METVETRRSGGSSKTSKKGGKRVKALTPEEEARRREEVKERLREKLELEKRALKVVERLLEDSVAEEFLVDCAKFITQANYKDAIEERFIAKLCGYPICPNKLGKIPTQQYKISTKTNKVYDITERKCFCSNFCYKASKEFELQIPKTALWLRQHESPPEIRLMKKGDIGSSGEEVMLSERRLQEEDIENPLTALPEDSHSSKLSSAAAGLSHSDSSDIEQEQDFVSSVVSQKQGRRVHWGDLPKHTDEDKKEEHAKVERRQQQRGKEDKEKKEECASRTEQLHRRNTEQVLPEDRELPEEASVEEATAKLNLCSLSQAVTHSTSLPDDSIATQPINTTPCSVSCTELNPPTESKPQLDLSHSTLTSTSNQNNHSVRLQNQSDFNITQMGMSKKGAAGLRDLLKNQSPALRSDSIRLKLLESLKRTLKEWSTDETLMFLYGADHSLGSPFADVKEENEKLEEELDEDDLEDEVTMEVEGGVSDRRPSAAAPDYETLRKETQQMELRISEFYKGTWIRPEELEESNENEATLKDQCTKNPALPLVDSNAQHLIQKRITVEKLTSCLRNIVGPLRLTMSDISTHLNNLVRTFRQQSNTS
ncbi:putative RNA polymerase II subunit B1 CTD phosphatase rpap2 isoform X2 [Anabas testudineus]|uniref:putative RNA polymerase II subunit B1 CTD phosphatase rpap2 isoform X2 n=1 Tax=Anabas testudineus TaxID=64144 RepID=UPI000E458763|nr:putative RNA polymerase II subunit B1 CTD phosphatase rpap2 isoform X2 [Anabas testudineus]